MTYPALGSKVTFIRQLPTGELLEGTATVLAICLDAVKRPMAHLEQIKEDGSADKFNVDLKLLNPSDETKAAFKIVTDEVKRLSDEGNKSAAETIGKYNKLIEDEFSTVLGEPVVFES